MWKRLWRTFWRQAFLKDRHSLKPMVDMPLRHVEADKLHAPDNARELMAKLGQGQPAPL